MPCDHHLRGAVATRGQLTDSPREARAALSPGILPPRSPAEPHCVRDTLLRLLPAGPHTPENQTAGLPPQLPTSDYETHCGQSPQQSPPPESWGQGGGLPATLSSFPFNAGTHTRFCLQKSRHPPCSPAHTLTGSSGRPGLETCHSGWTPAGWRSGAARSQRQRPRRPRLRFLTPCCCSDCWEKRRQEKDDAQDSAFLSPPLARERSLPAGGSSPTHGVPLLHPGPAS